METTVEQKIQEVINIILSDEEYSNYFFKNLQKMKNPENWFKPLLLANLISPENQLAIAYVRLLTNKRYNLHQENDFINLILEWLNSFQENSGHVVNVLWFIEEAVHIENIEIISKCKDIILEILLDPQKSFNVINSFSFNKFDTLLDDLNWVYKLAKLITEKENFNILSNNQHYLLQFNSKIFNLLYEKYQTEYINLIFECITTYSKENPIEFAMLDTIDQDYYAFTYGSYIFSILVDIINKNNETDNLYLMTKFENYVHLNQVNEIGTLAIIKIINYLINKTNKFEKIVFIQDHINLLDELQKIQYSLFHNVLKPGKEYGYKFLPEFEDWLSNLQYSQEISEYVNDDSKITRWSNSIKLTLLSVFKNESKLFNKLHDKLTDYEIKEPERTLNFKSSWQSENKLLSVMKQYTLEEIIQILNKEKPIPDTDFPGLHLEQALMEDFRVNEENKYTGKLLKLFTEIKTNKPKTWFIYEIAGLNSKTANPQYKEIIKFLISETTTDELYFHSIITLLYNLQEQKESLRCYKQDIKSFIINNIANFQDSSLDDIGGGINSIYGKSLLIIIRLYIEQNNKTLEGFVNDFGDFTIFFDKPNSFAILGQYLFWLFEINNFQIFFSKLKREYQLITLVTYFKYSSYVSKNIYSFSKEIKELLEEETYIYPYINHIFYMYLQEKDDYLLNIIDNHIENEPILVAVNLSINTYNKQIYEKNAQSKIVNDIWSRVVNSSHLRLVAIRYLSNADFICIENESELTIFKTMLEGQSINSISYFEKIHKKLFEILKVKKYNLILDILINLANNSERDSCYFRIEYFDNIINEISKIITDIQPEYEKLVILQTRLKQINYHIK